MWKKGRQQRSPYMETRNWVSTRGEWIAILLPPPPPPTRALSCPNVAMYFTSLQITLSHLGWNCKGWKEVKIKHRNLKNNVCLFLTLCSQSIVYCDICCFSDFSVLKPLGWQQFSTKVSNSLKTAANCALHSTSAIKKLNGHWELLSTALDFFLWGNLTYYPTLLSIEYK